MIGAFNTIYTALQGFLSRDFWTSTFAPVAFFAAIHTLIATALSQSFTFAALTSDASPLAKNLVLVVLGLVLVGYLVQPLLPLLRGLLDGSLLPAVIHDWLLVNRRPAINAEQSALTASLTMRTSLRTFAAELQDPTGAYRVAYVASQSLRTATRVDVVEKAEAEIEFLGSLMIRNAFPSRSQLDGARAAVLAALLLNDPSLPAGSADGALSLRLSEAADRLQDRADAAVQMAEADYDSRMARLRVADALRQPQATALGDARFVAERYSEDVYAVSFDFIWPRLVLAIRADAKDDPCNAAIEQGRARCDFAILSVVLSCSVPLFWLPFMLLRGGPGWLFLIIGGGTPAVVQFFYRLAFEAQLAFADIIKTTIDRHRFLVIKMFRQPMPASRNEERLTWALIRNAEQNAALAYLSYVTADAAHA